MIFFFFKQVQLKKKTIPYFLLNTIYLFLFLTFFLYFFIYIYIFFNSLKFNENPKSNMEYEITARFDNLPSRRKI